MSSMSLMSFMQNAIFNPQGPKPWYTDLAFLIEPDALALGEQGIHHNLARNCQWPAYASRRR